MLQAQNWYGTGVCDCSVNSTPPHWQLASNFLGARREWALDWVEEGGEGGKAGVGGAYMGILRALGVWKGLVHGSLIGGEDLGLVVLAWERKSSRNIGIKLMTLSSRPSRRIATLTAASMSISRCSRSRRLSMNSINIIK